MKIGSEHSIGYQEEISDIIPISDSWDTDAFLESRRS